MSGLSGITIAPDGIGHVLADYRLRVPFYQRAYAWKKPNVQDLFDDLNRAIDEGGKDYFLGSIVACSQESNTAEIVDGQQRLATISILLAAIRDHVLATDAEAARDIEREYLIRKHGIKQPERPSLTLSENDNEFFRKRILSRPDSDDHKTEPSRPSHKLIASAYSLAVEHVKNITAGRKPADQMTVIDNWLEFLRDRAKVVFIKVPDQADAFVIFETLNDRGLELSIADLTKNYIFGRSANRVEETKQNWNRMVGVLEAVSDNDITKFYIHQLWSSMHGITRDRELFSKMREKIHGENTAVTFSTQLADNAQLYAALRNADHEYWQAFGANTRRHVRILTSQLRVSQIRMLLLAVLDKFTVAEIKKVFPHAVCWSVRFLIAGGSPGNLEGYYANHSVRVRKGEIKNASELAKSMKAVLPTDDQFRAGFATETVTTEYLGRYYLRCLEKAKCGQAQPHLAEDDETIGSLEHVLPKSPDRKVWDVDDDTVAKLRYRIGNLALLSPTDNSNRGNDAFKKAKVYYAKSPFVLTSEISGCGDSWGEVEIDQRQREMAKLALKVWPI